MKDTYAILVVDDEPDILELMRLLLERRGYAVTMARNGIEALKSLERQRFDLLVTDIIMPEMDGFDLISRVRHHWRQMPVIAVSGGIRPRRAGGMAGMEQNGADIFLLKPFRSSELIDAVEQLLEGV